MITFIGEHQQNWNVFAYNNSVCLGVCLDGGRGHGQAGKQPPTTAAMDTISTNLNANCVGCAV